MAVWDCKSCVGTTSGLAGICIGSLGAPRIPNPEAWVARAPDPALAPTPAFIKDASITLGNPILAALRPVSAPRCTRGTLGLSMR